VGERIIQMHGLDRNEITNEHQFSDY
jgi:hypothetical protein